MAKDPKRVAAGKRSKQKGNAAEREVAKLLSAWWQEDFVRTPQSGGWGKHKSYQSKFGTSGDIVCPAEFPFCVESKAEEGWNLEQLLTSPEKCQTVKHWEQTVGETTGDKLPLLVFKRNYQPWFVMFSVPAIAAELKNKGNPILCLTTLKHSHVTIALLEHLMEIPKERILELMNPTMITYTMMNQPI